MKRRIETVVVMLMILSIVIPFGGCSKAGSQTGNTSTTDTSLTESTVPTYTPTPTPSPTPTPVPRLVEKVSFMDPEFYPENKDLPGYSEKKPSYRELYDEYGRIIELHDNASDAGGKTVYKYDDDGKLSRTYTSKNKSIVARSNYKYSENGLLMEEDNEHTYVVYSYDSTGRLTETRYSYTDYRYPEPIDVAKTEYEYNESGLLSIEKNTVINVLYDSRFPRTRMHEHAKMLEMLDIYGSSGYDISDMIYCFDYVIEYTYDNDELTMVKANGNSEYENFDITLSFENGILTKSKSIIHQKDEVESYDENRTITYEYNDEGCLSKKLTSWEDSMHKEAWCYEYDDNSMVLSETFYMSDEGSDEINYSSPKMRLLYKYYYE